MSNIFAPIENAENAEDIRTRLNGFLGSLKPALGSIGDLLSDATEYPVGTVLSAGGYSYEVTDDATPDIARAVGDATGLNVIARFNETHFEAWPYDASDVAPSFLTAVASAARNKSKLVLPSKELGVLNGIRLENLTADLYIEGVKGETVIKRLADSLPKGGSTNLFFVRASSGINITLKNIIFDGNAEENPLFINVTDTAGFVVGEVVTSPNGSFIIVSIPSGTTFRVDLLSGKIDKDDVLTGGTSASETAATENLNMYQTAHALNIRLGQLAESYGDIYIEGVQSLDPCGGFFAAPTNFKSLKIERYNITAEENRKRRSAFPGVLLDGSFGRVDLSFLDSSVSLESANSSTGAPDSSASVRIDNSNLRYFTTTSKPAEGYQIKVDITNSTINRLISCSGSTVTVNNCNVLLNQATRLSTSVTNHPGEFVFINSVIRLNVEGLSGAHVYTDFDAFGPPITFKNCEIIAEGAADETTPNALFSFARMNKGVRFENSRFDLTGASHVAPISFEVRNSGAHQGPLEVLSCQFYFTPTAGALRRNSACIFNAWTHNTVALDSSAKVVIRNNEIIGSAYLLHTQYIGTTTQTVYCLSGNRHRGGALPLIVHRDVAGLVAGSVAPHGSGAAYLWLELDDYSGLTPFATGPVLKGQRWKVLGAGPGDVLEYVAEATTNEGGTPTWVPVVTVPT